jgi:hypothetical protein
MSNDANRLPRLGWFGMARGIFKEATAFNIGAWNAASANTSKSYFKKGQAMGGFLDT